MKKTADCPICEKQADLSESNLYRPFCSERCRLIDLGQWINESYSIVDSTSANIELHTDTKQKH